MRKAGQIVAGALDLMRGMIAPGVSTIELDEAAEGYIRAQGAVPSFKGYMGFPATICASVNDEIVHGIPSARTLADGDIISVDCGAIWDGYQGDAAITVAVGQVSGATLALMVATKAALKAGTAAARDGARLGDVSHAIEQMAIKAGVEVVREYGGHGIGREMHEDPRISNWGPPGRGIKLRSGMTICLEPMFALGDSETVVSQDGWTVSTRDGSPSAHFEYTIAVTQNGGEILTSWQEAEMDGGDR